MFTLDRPTCVRNRWSAFQVVQGFSASAGRCSSALMSQPSRGSSRSLHSSMRAAFAVWLMGSVHLMKLFRDFRHGTSPRCPLSGCLWSVVCLVRTVRLATALHHHRHTIFDQRRVDIIDQVEYVWLMGSVHLMKLFRDFRHGTSPRCPLSGCLWPVVCLVRTVRLATALHHHRHTIFDQRRVDIIDQVEHGVHDRLHIYALVGYFTSTCIDTM